MGGEPREQLGRVGAGEVPAELVGGLPADPSERGLRRFESELVTIEDRAGELAAQSTALAEDGASEPAARIAAGTRQTRDATRSLSVVLEDPATKKAAEARNQASERLDSANQNLRQGVELVREELTTDGQLPADERRADERLLAALDDAQQDLERGLEEVGQLIAERRQAKRTARAERQAAREAAEAAEDDAASEPAPEAPVLEAVRRVRQPAPVERA